MYDVCSKTSRIKKQPKISCQGLLTILQQKMPTICTCQVVHGSHLITIRSSIKEQLDCISVTLQCSRMQRSPPTMICPVNRVSMVILTCHPKDGSRPVKTGQKQVNWKWSHISWSGFLNPSQFWDWLTGQNRDHWKPCLSISAPPSRRASMTSSWPQYAALYNGVGWGQP